MTSGKKITKEDTWRSDDLIKHIRSQEEESRRRERSHRDPERERRKHRGESGRRAEERDERKRDQGDTSYRDGEKERQRERYKDREKERQRERNKDREKERQRERNKDRDREKEKERDRDGLRERERQRQRERAKEREKDLEIEKKTREKDRDRIEERDREKDREGEKRDRERDREKRDREKDRGREREAVRERGEEGDREKYRERERAEQENERRKGKEVSLDGDDRYLEREKYRKERHREREHRRDGGRHRNEEKETEQREQERREKHSHRQHTGQTDREERRELRRREKEQHVDREIAQRRRRPDGDRVSEGEERDEQREQRHNDSNQRHREHESKHRNTEQAVENKVTEDIREDAEDYGNEDYEDDFEDYEEDFEEFDEGKEEEDEEEEVREAERREAERALSPRSRREVEAIQRAMEKENELVSAVHSTTSSQEAEISHRASTDSESRSRKSWTYGRVIDFTAARQRERNQQAADKQKKRSAELLRLIDLDFSVTECLLDLPPVREYDLYIKTYGMANTKQVYVQCNEDNIERDTQTEETDVTDKWTQHPPETNVACGGPQASQNASDEAVTRTTLDSKQLAVFLHSATQVMAVLLEENNAERSSMSKLQSQTHTQSFSDGCVQLNSEVKLLQGRQVTLLHFSQTQTHTLLSVHAPHSSSNDVTLDSKTLVCVWNIWEPSTPQRILIYEAEVRCCCFSPGKATLVFAGTGVGSVLVWDLRERPGSHSHIRVCEEEWTLRHPTFSTDAVLSGAGHFSSVVSVEPVLVNVGAGLRDPLLSDQEESLGLSFQLGSLDENGLLNLWVVVELPKADDSGSQTDLGLRPGGKVKLLHSSALQTTPRVDKGVMGLPSHLSFVLKFLPSDSNHYFIGSNMGLVRHGTRHGLRAFPKLYRPKNRERPAEVTVLEFCPTGEPFFLVGCSDGSMRLHALACAEAVCEWVVGSGRGAVRCLQFSPTRCSVFCALDSASVLHIWDLAQRDKSPLITHDLHTDPVSVMSVFGDATRQNPYSGIALAKHSGRLEIHFLLSSLTLPQTSDTEKLRSLACDTL